MGNYKKGKRGTGEQKGEGNSGVFPEKGQGEEGSPPAVRGSTPAEMNSKKPQNQSVFPKPKKKLETGAAGEYARGRGEAAKTFDKRTSQGQARGPGRYQ